MAKWWKSVFLSFFLIGIVAVLSTHYFINRPIVYYYVEAADSYDGIRPLDVKLKFKNAGQSYVAAVLVLSVKNATIVPPPPAPYISCTESELRIEYGLEGGGKDYAVYDVAVSPKKGAKTFALSYVVEKAFELTQSGAVGCIFGEIHPYYPTSLTYNMTSEGIYIKVEG